MSVVPWRGGGAERETQRQREMDTETERQRQRETEIDRGRETETEREREKNRERERQTDRQTDRQTVRQTDRDRQDGWGRGWTNLPLSVLHAEVWDGDATFAVQFSSANKRTAKTDFRIAVRGSSHDCLLHWDLRT